MLTPKSRPRHLPTLTQVVTEAELLRGTHDSDPVPSPPDTAETDAQVQKMVNLLLPKVMARMREEMRERMEAQLHQLEAKLHDQVEAMVRDAMNGCETFPEV